VGSAVSLLLSSLLIIGCGDDGMTTPDGNMPVDGSVADGSGVTPPDIPWLDEGIPPIAPPVLTPCPDGWREVVDGDVTTCDPYPEGGAATCPPGQAHFAGEPACRVVGDPCPAGDFADGLPTDGSVIYVLAGATGGDGSAAAPYGSLDQVPWISTAGKTVALSKGAHAGIFGLRPSTRVVGACAAETTVISPSALRPTAQIDRIGEAAVLANLTIADAPQGCAVTERSAALEVRGVILDGCFGIAAFAFNGGDLTVEDVLVRGTRPFADGTFGAALGTGRAEGTFSRVVLEDNQNNGIVATGEESIITITDVAIRDMEPSTRSGGYGIGLTVQSGRVEVSRTILEQSLGVAVQVQDGGTVTLTDSVVRDTLPRRGDELEGHAARIYENGTFEASRMLFERNRRTAITPIEDGATVTLTDIIIRDTMSDADGNYGAAIAALNGNRVDVERAIFERNVSSTVFGIGDDQLTTLTDVVIRDGLPGEADGRRGRGVEAIFGARAELERVLVERCHDVGVLAAEVGFDPDIHSSVSLTDVVVRDISSEQSNGRFGQGVMLQFGADGDATRLLLERNQDMGLFIGGAGRPQSFTGSDIVIRETAEEEDRRTGGNGLQIQEGPTVDISRIRLEQNREVAVVVIDATATLRDVAIDSVLSQACIDSTCAGDPAGHGIAVVGTGTVDLSDFSINNPFLCGAFLANSAALDLASGVVSGAEIGACVQVPDYDTSRLTNEVTFIDNGVNLDSTMLPIPGAADTRVVEGL